MNKNHSFHKTQKLKSKKDIDDLFNDGKNAFTFPLKVVFKKQENEEYRSLPKIAISVSKRKFKKAVDRNTIKRRIREAYRLNNDMFKTFAIESKTKYDILFIYIGNEISPYEVIHKSIIKILKSIVKDNGTVDNKS
ncbi:MAG: ribonuclease protein component [Bacteroidota bacterium]|jgi:ribonuclease P protein component